jgi:hypothetical protein
VVFKMETLYAVIIHPKGEIIEVGFTKRQARRYCRTFNRLMKDSRIRVRKARLVVSWPSCEAARERSQ